ncbi:membrane protein insertase YidC [Psychroserpens sp.]|uniref:membrane protein insertase YidC n=1 Tax=Psychroserpens sp. TaxID=2020870 RepID=UPI001B1F9A2F|nr:membrane protein insertase YidC [Psychroserpens sp.]MBO6606912.1 membrane protein insertase YidC [Psychroserpens sp.]MBO6654058.1 membrane protein insertase YidC [Psychroserpens sp.]MBO6682656.1 membrane protein insertase YidC [Psychroserpens sp.]MBO6750684.1 membrane protein insertase YidC [Psychroserpens sp.]MBO6915887.1 membrane protein insertase YidC [Psychroserpens sp.]
MEEKKLDINSIIGFILIFGILLYMMYQNAPTPEEIAEQEKQEQIEADKKAKEAQQATDTKVTTAEDYALGDTSDSLKVEALKSKLGSFAYASTLPSGQDNETDLSTELFDLKFSNKGGFLSEVILKSFVDYDSIPIALIQNGNESFNITFPTADNRILNTKDLYFEPNISKNGDNTVVSMRLKVSESQYLEYRYELKPDDYMIDFTIRSQGLSGVVNSSQDINLEWGLKTYRHDQSITYENRYTRLTYMHEGDKIDKLAQMTDDEEDIQDVRWLSYRQHFFSTILVANEPIKKATITSVDLVQDEEVDTVFTKSYNSKLPLTFTNGEADNNFSLYFGPTDSKVLKNYEYSLDESIPFGWGIFGWINKAIFIPLFAFLSSFLPYGIAIIVMTVLIKLMMSFVQYKQFLSQAKLRVLKPELDEIRAKYKDNKMKAQQETMALQNKAGASPLAGCLPGLIQLPVFYALFMFFPTAFDLRQKSFLWADDLSSYDVIAELPFSIPFYGDHVSLFPILAAIAIFFYMKMTTGQQMASQPTQEGMPDMSKMMKYMIYFSPLLMLVFFNQYASGLSLYYFISNVISIGIMLVIKNYILDEEKIHAQIQENKAKPKKQNKFQKKMAEMMEQAEQQKQMQQRRKR